MGDMSERGAYAPRARSESRGAYAPRSEKASPMSTDRSSSDSSGDRLRQARSQLERAVRAGEAARAEDLLAAFPDLADDTEAVLELAYTEFVVREELGQSPSTADWLARFPRWRVDLEQLFEVHAEFRD